MVMSSPIVRISGYVRCDSIIRMLYAGDSNANVVTYAINMTIDMFFISVFFVFYCLYSCFSLPE